MMTYAGEFLDTLYTLAQTNDQKASYHVFAEIDEILNYGDYVLCDQILDTVDLDRISTSAMRSMLVITYDAKDVLCKRAGLFDRVRAKMIERRGPEITQRLLSRLG